MSRDRQLETKLSSPGNHWEYKQDWTCWTIWARWRAAKSLAVVSVSSSSFSIKLDFLSQPVDVVLSPIARRHDSGSMVPSIESSQIQIIEPINSKRFMWARPKRCVGIIHRHALPLYENPPNPCSHVSERYTWVGFRYVSIFILIPLFAC